RQQANRLQARDAEVLRVVDEQDAVAAQPALLDEKRVELVEPSANGSGAVADPEIVQNLLDQLRILKKAVEDERHRRVRASQLGDQIAAERRLAEPDLPGDDDEPLALLNAEQGLVHERLETLRQEVAARIRRNGKRVGLQAEPAQVGGG